MRRIAVVALALLASCGTRQDFYAEQDRRNRQLEAQRAASNESAYQRLRAAEHTIRVEARPGEIRAAQAAVRKGLRDPASATFENTYIVQDKDNPQIRYLCGAINAKNGFGGFTGLRPFYAGIDGSLPFISNGTNQDYLRFSLICQPRPI
jgi:hypothetical protein